MARVVGYGLFRSMGWGLAVVNWFFRRWVVYGCTSGGWNCRVGLMGGPRCVTDSKPGPQFLENGLEW